MVFVPQHRTKAGHADDRHLLNQLHQTGILSFTPTGTYDDRFVLKYAKDCGGIVVSNDQFNLLDWRIDPGATWTGGLIQGLPGPED